jgi:hypothetical protein
MKHLALAVVVTLLMMALPAIVRAQKASCDYDSTVNFSQFRTYAWKPGTPAGEHFLDKRIVSSIDAQLAAKGLARTNSTPDLYVLYHVGLGVQRSVSGFVSGPGGAYGWRGGLDSIDVRLNELATGTLVIDLVDAANQELVWRGVATKEIDVEAKPEKRDEAIAKTVDKILRNYPPKSRA